MDVNKTTQIDENEKRGLKGNKGEWSEIYVFLRLLATGKLIVADENLNAIPSEFYKVLEILRNETGTTNYYVREDDKITIICSDENQNENQFSFPVIEFADKANYLLNRLKETRAQHHPIVTDFLSKIKVNSIKDAKHKRDITIKIEDFHSTSKQTLGFSIKSFLGSNSTLFNPAAGTNFIFKVELPEDQKIDIDKFNADTYKLSPKIKSRIQELISKYKATIKFDHIQSDCLSQNLRTIDGDLPFLISELLLARYTKSKKSSVKECTKVVTKLNPLNFDLKSHGQVYEYKIKRFLHDCALGMTPEKGWTGIYDATGGQIIVKKDGDIVCYHIYELNRFMEYLFNSTKLEEAVTSENPDKPGEALETKKKKKYQFGWLYLENGEIYIKLNLQIRFR